jgi:hypothetical protein
VETPSSPDPAVRSHSGSDGRPPGSGAAAAPADELAACATLIAQLDAAAEAGDQAAMIAAATEAVADHPQAAVAALARLAELLHAQTGLCAKATRQLREMTRATERANARLAALR